MRFWSAESTNGVSTRICHKWNNFYLFWFKIGCAWLWLAKKFLQKWRWFFFFVVETRLSCKTMCAMTAKQYNCQFLVLKTNFQNVAVGFALFTIVETSRFIGWEVKTLFVPTCWTKHISKNLLYSVVHTQVFFLYLVDWNRTFSNSCLLGTNFIFFSEEKACFICFCRFYMLL